MNEKFRFRSTFPGRTGPDSQRLKTVVNLSTVVVVVYSNIMQPRNAEELRWE